MSRLAVALEVLRRRPLAWLGRAALVVAGYHGLLLAGAALRLGSWPNYLEVYPYAANLARIVAHTPSWRDAFIIALGEPWLEVGRRLPEYRNISEWTLTVEPARLPVIALAALLVSLFTLLGPGGGRLLAGLGGGAAGLANAVVGWAVCCGSSSWAVLLALLGLDAVAAFAIEPYGPLFTAAGLALLAAAVLLRAGGCRR